MKTRLNYQIKKNSNFFRKMDNKDEFFESHLN